MRKLFNDFDLKCQITAPNGDVIYIKGDDLKKLKLLFKNRQDAFEILGSRRNAWAKGNAKRYIKNYMDEAAEIYTSRMTIKDNHGKKVSKPPFCAGILDDYLHKDINPHVLGIVNDDNNNDYIIAPKKVFRPFG